jgi:hypothetical protein
MSPSGLRPFSGRSWIWRGLTVVLRSALDALRTSAPAMTSTVSLMLPISSVAVSE